MKKYIIGTFVLLHSYVIIAQIQIKCVDTIYYDPASGIYDIATFQPSVSGTDQYDLKYEIFEINKGNCVENHCRTDSIVWTISADNQIYNCSHLVKINKYPLDSIYTIIDTLYIESSVLPIDASLGLNNGFMSEYNCNIGGTYLDEYTYTGMGVQINRNWTFIDWCDTTKSNFEIIFNIDRIQDQVVFGADWLDHKGNAVTYPGLQYDIHSLTDCSGTIDSTYADIQYLYCGESIASGLPPRLYSDENPLDGVSTLDLVLIQRHILNMLPLDQAHKLISADVTNDQRISVIDLLELRKLIVGIIDHFQFNHSVVGIIDDTKTKPYDFPYASYTIVKIGDVNNTAISGLQNEVSTENRSSLALRLPNQVLNENQNMIVPIYLDSPLSLNGMQATITWDIDNLDILDLESGALSMDDYTINRAFLADGLLPFLWSSAESLTLDSDEPLFYIKLKAKRRSPLKNNIAFCSSITESIAYNDQLEAYNMQLNIVDRNAIEELSIFPNPATDRLFINRASGDTIQIRIFNLNGIEVLNTISKGIEPIPLGNIPDGIYFAQFNLNNGKSITQK